MTSLVSNSVFRGMESLKSGGVKGNQKKSPIRFFTRILNTTGHAIRKAGLGVINGAHTLTLIVGGNTGSLGNIPIRNKASVPAFNINGVTVRKHFRHTDPGIRHTNPGRVKKPVATSNASNASSVRRRITDTLARTLPFGGKASVKSTETSITTAAKSVPLAAAQKRLVSENLTMLMNDMRNQMNIDSDIEGVFRKAGVNTRIAEIKNIMASEAMTADMLTGYSLDLKANVLKRVMEDLASPPDGKPLFDKETLAAITQPDADVSRILKEAIDRLDDDDDRKDNLNRIIDFLAGLPKEVPDFALRSKMTNHNLAIVTAPKLLPDSMKGSLDSIQGITKAFEKVLDTWMPSTVAPAQTG